VSHAGSALLAQIADKSGLTKALSGRLASLKARRSGHDSGRVVRDLAVMLADGGDCFSDLGAVRDQDALFGAVASHLTRFWVIDAIASTPNLLDASPMRTLSRASASGHRARRPTASRSRSTRPSWAAILRRRARPATTRAATAFYPLMAYCDETGEALAAVLRPANAGSNTAADHIEVIEDALAQIPAELIETVETWCAQTPRARRTSCWTSAASTGCDTRSATS
jgi:hypothetical protein